MRYVFAIMLMLICLVATAVRLMAADAKTPVFTDPEKAGIEFKLQGEYVGEVDLEDGKKKIGVQVVALGDGKFDGIAYIGGLPGDDWKRGDEKHARHGELNDDQVEFTDDNLDAAKSMPAILKEGRIALSRDNKSIGQLKKVERKSPTLGARPPKGAIVLFDGSGVDAWENGKLVEKKYLGATDCWSKRKFGDHMLHIEFRTPFMPTARGQARGNSGVYIQSRYECQVLDSFGLEGEDNECGGIYSIAKPAVNMCYPPLAWQTYDIDFTAARYDKEGNKTKNARVTIKHNGVVIHDDLKLTHGTPGRYAEGPEPESLFLQNHGNPVVFRNIWVLEK